MSGQAMPFARGGAGAGDGNLMDRLIRPQSGLAAKLVGFSGLINILTLSVSLYMMQVYDRVLTSQSGDTLLFLTLATVLAVTLSSLLEAVRQQIANRVGTWLAQRLAPHLLERSLEQRLVNPGARLEALRELGTVKNFVSTPTLFNLLDILWFPIYVIVIFMLHPWFGAVALVGALGLFGLAFLNERMTRSAIRSAQAQGSTNLQYAECLVRNGEVIDAMGMGDDCVRHWSRGQQAELDEVDRTQARSSKLLAASKFLRQLVQILLLAVGALLVLGLEITAGAMIAGSIIVARLLAPIESSIGYWKQFVLARQSFERLYRFCGAPRLRTSEMRLPDPTGRIAVKNLTYVPPGLPMPILRGVSFSLEPGELLAIVGPSASGKTTLSRLIAGVLKPSAGHARLDDAETFSWMRSDFGRHIGYLPQDIELLPGTVRANISRFRDDAQDEQVIAAAVLADCHNMILELIGGYETVLTEGGVQLSGGQRQRVGLARALFGSPRVVILDEPNSSLDTLGEEGLERTLLHLKERKVTTIMVAHRTKLLDLADKILVLQEGRAVAFGPADDVRAAYDRQPRQANSAQVAPNGATAEPQLQSLRD